MPALPALGERRGRPGDLGRLRQLAPTQDRVERLDQRLDRQVPLLGLARGDRREQLPQPMAAQPGGDLDRPAAGQEPRGCTLLREGVPASQALEQDEPPGVEVRARCRPLAGELLGRGVEGCAQELTRLRQRLPPLAAAALSEPAQAEVQDQGTAPHARGREHQVGGLEIPVEDALRVGAGQRFEHLGQQPDRFTDGERALAREHPLERLTRDVREDRVELSRLGLARVDQRYDVRVRERGADPGFAAEALHLATG